jgi:hypothetical protein
MEHENMLRRMEMERNKIREEEEAKRKAEREEFKRQHEMDMERIRMLDRVRIFMIFIYEVR